MISLVYQVVNQRWKTAPTTPGKDMHTHHVVHVMCTLTKGPCNKPASCNRPASTDTAPTLKCTGSTAAQPTQTPFLFPQTQCGEGVWGGYTQEVLLPCLGMCNGNGIGGNVWSLGCLGVCRRPCVYGRPRHLSVPCSQRPDQVPTSPTLYPEPGR